MSSNIGLLYSVVRNMRGQANQLIGAIYTGMDEFGIRRVKHHILNIGSLVIATFAYSRSLFKKRRTNASFKRLM
jgi:hypothetical protein